MLPCSSKVENVALHDAKLVLSEIAKVFPAVDSRIVKVVKFQQDAVVALRFYAYDVNKLTAEDEALLIGASMALYLGTGAFNAEIFSRQFHLAAFVPLDIEDLKA